uniref:Programmed cell death protein 2 C-terminal domain-containing protein n=1 Tax=Trichobilharzia regenti TaxID=157069 RepID=A0AA85IQQ5_TRIRE|nr:unnamed protein product [Trichobilharzia regenti]
MMPSKLALGFAASGTPWHLISHLFPDKIGGRPAWLALSHLPSPSELACPVCLNPMCFVLQLYSPLSEKSDCFHRMLFLFMCRKGGCHHEVDQTPFYVFRSQLPRENCYYSFEPPENEYPSWETVKSLLESNSLPCAAKYCSLCPVCGCKAEKGVRSVRILSIVQKFISDDETKALESIAKKETKEEVRFRKFKESMKSAPDQVVRFQRGGKPIWLSDSPPVVKNCEVCGAERIFEFQVTPQLLCHLHLDRVDEPSPDFGSLYIFTCSNSCALPRKKERMGNAGESCTSDLDGDLIEYQREVVIRQGVP